MIVMDTYAWIEYFLGTKKGVIVKEYFDNNLITPSIVLIEISCKSAKENWNFKELLQFIKSKSNIKGMNEEVIEKIGEVYLEERRKKPKFGMIDAAIWAIAENLQAKIITGDEHFKDFKEVILLK